MPAVDLICLANSHKWRRRCVAGLRVDGGGWVRPVSDKEHGELEYSQYRLPDYTEPHLFDVIRVGLSHPRPLPHQPENWVVDNSPWELLDRPASAELAPMLAAAVQDDPEILGNKSRSAPYRQFLTRPARESLALVKPVNIRWHVEFSTYELRNVPRVRFRLQELEYDLPLTDPQYAGPLQRRDEGDYVPSDFGIPEGSPVLFTISLGEPLDGVCYKLVAGVAILPREWPGL